MSNNAARRISPAAWTVVLAAVLATAAHAGIGVGPHLPHSETLARRDLPTGDPAWIHTEDRHACGGVGERSQAIMRALAPRYDLALTFATRSGHYMAGVEVAVLDRQGRRVLHVTCDGPMLLLQLPDPGRYTVVASASGREVRQPVRVGARGGAAAVLRWPGER